MLFDQRGIEAIVPRRYGCVSRKDDFPRHSGHRGFKRNAFVFHAHANGFEHSEGAVSFVEVKDARRDSESLQGAQATYPQQQFLTDANAKIAAI